jgi:hypothetical protein
MKIFIKKISALIVISAIASFYSGCNRSHLDLLPHGPTEESYFTGENDFAKAVLGVYAKINDVYWYRGNPYMCTMPVYLLPGDDITTNEANEEFEIFGSL